MTLKPVAIITLAALFAAPQAPAQDTLIDYLVESCQTDLAQYCSQVTPGNGRLLHCMAAHADKISGQCEYAFYQAASLLEALAVAVNYFAQECKADIETHCSDVVAGDGRILACLGENVEAVNSNCKQAITDILGE